MPRPSKTPTALRILRLTRTIKQAEMARLIGVTQATWSLYELGTITPPFEKRVQIAAILGTLPRELWPELVA